MGSKKNEWAAADGSRRSRKGDKKSSTQSRKKSIASGDSHADVLRAQLQQEEIDAKGGNAIVPIRSLLRSLRGIVENRVSDVEAAIVETEMSRLRLLVRGVSVLSCGRMS